VEGLTSKEAREFGSNAPLLLGTAELVSVVFLFNELLLELEDASNDPEPWNWEDVIVDNRYDVRIASPASAILGVDTLWTFFVAEEW